MATAAQQRHTVLSCFLGWTLDAFDFFIMIFIMADIAREFGTSITTITWALTLTLGLRVVGAVIFGRLADRFGRKPTLLANILLFSVLSFLSGLAPNLAVFLVLRSLYGIAMGGEWGVGTALAMETVPARWRGLVSGILQSGYPTGYLLAALLYGIGFETLGWRGMFMVALLPAVIIFYIRRKVPESPAWSAQSAVAARTPLMPAIRRNWRLVASATLLMAAAATFSHGTQDLYPTFLRVQHGFGVREISLIAVIYNVGAIAGSLVGGALSQLIGRRRQIMAASALSLLILPFWASASSLWLLAATAFALQFLVQCTFGVLPAHLNEIAPAEIRGTFSGVVYQLGNMLTAANATAQAFLAEGLLKGDYGTALALTAGAGAIILCVSAALSSEARDDLLERPAPAS